MLKTLLDLIYPARCPVCGDIALPRGSLVCPGCKDKLVYIKEPRCKKCSKPIEREEQEYCNDCERKTFHFSKGYALWIYDETMKLSVSNFKYKSRKEYASFYVNEMFRLYESRILDFFPDVIVPVPIHKSKMAERGYNQADLLARGLGKKLNLPVMSELLVRNRKTLPQKKLSDKERLRNLTDAFEVNKKLMQSYARPLSKVLLVDDIYTTGSTIEACTNVLRSQGIKEVYFIVLCIGKGY